MTRLPILFQTALVGSAVGAGNTNTKTVTTLPDSFDWRDTAGAVQPIRDQGKCGNSQAFAAAAVMETADFLTNKRSNVLSVQQFLDCVRL
jgi:C1A family cysteine protease